jgi:GT2 family glycosyltransferase
VALERRDWETLGGFDPGFEEPPYWADVDLSWRAERLGRRLHVVPVALEHKRNGSSRALLRQDAFWDGWHRNRARFLAKLAAAGDPRGDANAERTF